MSRNITISIEEDLLDRARMLASRRGVSLQELLREQVRRLVGERPSHEVADELMALMHEHPGRSGGAPWSRDDAYEGRL